MNIHKNIHEMRIKVRCAQWLPSLHGDFSRGVLINEFSANKSRVRADLVYVSDREIIAVEIKSKQDNIGRLDIQIPQLRKLYNRVEVVTTRNHLERAYSICKNTHIGLHIIEDDEIETILRGRKRNIDPSALRKRVFPRHVRDRKDFTPTESFYRDFLTQKYRATEQPPLPETGTFEGESHFIRSLNPHHSRRLEIQRRKNAYYRDLEALSLSLQSTHSSSNSSDDTSIP